MIDSIYNTKELFPIIRGCCEENNVSVEFCDDLLRDGEIDYTVISILKIDQYYNTKDFAKPPPAIDCLVVVNKAGAEYCLYLIELKGIGRPSNYKKNNIINKFKTTFDDFISIRFSDIFLNESFNIYKIESWLVTDIYSNANLSEDQFRKKIKSSSLDYLTAIKPFRIRGIVTSIQIKRNFETICT